MAKLTAALDSMEGVGGPTVGIAWSRPRTAEFARLHAPQVLPSASQSGVRLDRPSSLPSADSSPPRPWERARRGPRAPRRVKPLMTEPCLGGLGLTRPDISAGSSLPHVPVNALVPRVRSRPIPLLERLAHLATPFRLMENQKLIDGMSPRRPCRPRGDLCPARAPQQCRGRRQETVALAAVLLAAWSQSHKHP